MSIYIRATDLPLWERAEQYAREHRMPMSGLVMMALERFLAEQGPPPKRRR